MQEYTFKHGPFYFQVQADEDKEAVNRARRAIEESFPEDDKSEYLPIDLTGGAFAGRLYIEPREITVANICKRVELPEPETSVPF